MADSEPSRPKRFVPTYFVARNLSNASAALSRSRMRCLASLSNVGAGPLDLGLDPALLLGVLDVHVLDADRAAVGVAQHAEQVAERHLLDAGDAAGEELAVEVPDRQPVRQRVELLGHRRLLPAERVEVGDEVAADAVDADQRGDLHLLVQHRLFAVDRVDVGPPAHRLVRHAQRGEHVVVEPVLAEQQLVDPLEEQAALGALDDAVVVRAGDRDDLADPQRAEVGAVGALELGRVVDGPDADDDALAGHQAGHALDGADRARVGQRDGGALEVVDGQLVGLDLADDLLVGGEEAGEVERVGVAHDGDDERAAAVGLLDVDGEAHVDGVVLDEAGLAVGAGDERVAQVGHGVGDGPHDGVADDVGEADLAHAAAGAVAVDDLAVDLEQLGRDVAEAGRRRHAEAALHVGGDGGAGAADRGTLLLGGGGRRGRRRGRRGRGGRRRRRRGRRRLRRAARSGRRGRGGRGGAATVSSSTRGRRRRRGAQGGVGRLVVGEELLPRLPHRIRVVPVLLVHLFDQPGVGPETRTRRRRRAHMTRVPVHRTCPGRDGRRVTRRPRPARCGRGAPRSAGVAAGRGLPGRH